MSKKVSKQEKTLEELLEEALVPEEEQPYKVPGNWVWVRLGQIIKTKSGDPLTQKEMNGFGSIPVYGGNGVTGYHDKYNVEEETITLGRVGFYCGSVHYTPKKAWVTDNALIVSTSQNYIDTNFLFLLLKQLGLRKYSNSTAQPVVSMKTINPIKMPLPPLSEQKRIVNRIESLFNKINEAKELIEEARETFTNRWAAILAKAFRGELTKKWREEHPDVEPAEKLLERIKEEKEKLAANGKCRKKKDELPPIDPPYELPEGWCWVRLGEISYLITKGASPKWQGINYVDDKSQVLFITSENVGKGFLLLQSPKYVEINFNEVQKRSILEKDDILLNIVGASIGRAAIFDKDCLANINQAVSIIRLMDKTCCEFIMHYLNSPIAINYYNSEKVDVARANLSLVDVANIPIPLPPTNEVKVVVRKLKMLSNKEENIAMSIISQDILDTISNSILSKAFRGELGTNNTEEESALELLKEVLKEKSKAN